MTTPTANVEELFQAAEDEGILSKASVTALAVMDVGAQIEAALGVPALDVQSSEVVLVTMMIDDSGSIRYARNEQAVRDGHNLVLGVLSDPKLKLEARALIHTCYLNGKILYEYRQLSQAEQMTPSNYDAYGGTPLYDQSMVLLGTVVAKAQEFANEGVPVRTITLIVTDGNDEHSVRATPAAVRTLVKDMLQQENHIIAAMGISDGETDFRAVFQEMGILDEWILTPNSTRDEIVAAFHLFSQSASSASQNAQSFSETAMGGFGQKQ